MTIIGLSLFYAYYVYAKHYYSQEFEYLHNGKIPISINLKKWGFSIIASIVINLIILLFTNSEFVVLGNTPFIMICLFCLKLKTHKITKYLKKGK